MNSPESLESHGYRSIPLPASIEEVKYDEPIDPLEIMLGSVPFMLEKARTSQYKAESYRDFLVVCSAFAFDSIENRVGIITTGNFKAKIPEEDKDEFDMESIPKVCAELDATETARESGFTDMLAYTISATGDRNLIKAVTGKPSSTLHPCDECRSFMANNSMVKPEALVLTTSFNRDIVQLQSVNELLDLYKYNPTSHEEPAVRRFSPLIWPLIQRKYRQKVSQGKLALNDFTMDEFAHYAKIARRVIGED